MKTPGGKLVYHHIKKLATSPKCGDCGIALPGVSVYTINRVVGTVADTLDLGPCSPPAPVRGDFQTPKDRATGIWWEPVR